MKNILLGIIAINLTFISANLALSSVGSVYAEDPDNTKSCMGTACISQGPVTKMKTDGGDEFTRLVKRIIVTCRVQISGGITNIVPNTNIGVGGKSRGKIICD